MSENRQYIAVRFKPGATKSYTYHWDGDPIAVGERVVVESFDGKGTQRVEVVSIVPVKPPFQTKPIKSVVGGQPENLTDRLFQADEDAQSMIDRERE